MAPRRRRALLCSAAFWSRPRGSLLARECGAAGLARLPGRSGTINRPSGGGDGGGGDGGDDGREPAAWLTVVVRPGRINYPGVTFLYYLTTTSGIAHTDLRYLGNGIPHVIGVVSLRGKRSCEWRRTLSRVIRVAILPRACTRNRGSTHEVRS